MLEHAFAITGKAAPPHTSRRAKPVAVRLAEHKAKKAKKV